MSVNLPKKDELDFLPVYVVPEQDPEQMVRLRNKRDVFIAQSLGAEWVPGELFMQPGPHASKKDIEELELVFSSDEARERSQASFSALLDGKSKPEDVRMAALREFGDVRLEQLGSENSADRIYLYCSPEKGSDFHPDGLRDLAKREDIALLFDFDRDSENYGAFYVFGEENADKLSFYKSVEAKREHQSWKIEKAAIREVMINEANLMAGPKGSLIRPLTAPNPKRDPAGFEAAQKAIKDISRDPERLKKLVHVTNLEMDAVRLTEVKYAAQGMEFPAHEKIKFANFQRGARLGSLFLNERTIVKTEHSSELQKEGLKVNTKGSGAKGVERD